MSNNVTKPENGKASPSPSAVATTPPAAAAKASPPAAKASPAVPSEATVPSSPAAKAAASTVKTAATEVTTPVPVPTSAPVTEVIRVPIARLVIDHAWNARSKSDTDRVIPEGVIGYDPETESSGMGGVETSKNSIEPGLIEMIAEQGQLDPVDVHYIPAKGGKDLFLDAGFRRSTALARIAERGVKEGNFFPIKADPKWDARNPTILAVVGAKTPFTARLRNLNENTGRNALRTPDLAFGIADLKRLAKEEKRELKGVDIAREIGKSPTMVSQILAVMGYLPKTVTEHWRSGGEAILAGVKVAPSHTLGLSVMYNLACETKDEPDDVKEREYAKLLVTAPTNHPKGKSPEAKSFETALKKAKRVGELFGYFAFVINNPERVTAGEWNLIVEDCIAYVRPSGTAPTESQVRRMTETLKDAFKDEQIRLSSPEGEEADESEEVTQKKRDRRDGGR